MSADSYVVLVEDEPGALERLSEQVGRRLAGAGWRKVVARPYLEVFAPATSRLEITEGLDGHGVVLGQIFDNEGRALSKDDRGAVACRPLDPTRAERIVRSHWGRYVLVRRVLERRRSFEIRPGRSRRWPGARLASPSSRLAHLQPWTRFCPTNSQ